SSRYVALRSAALTLTALAKPANVVPAFSSASRVAYAVPFSPTYGLDSAAEAVTSKLASRPDLTEPKASMTTLLRCSATDSAIGATTCASRDSRVKVTKSSGSLTAWYTWSEILTEVYG